MKKYKYEPLKNIVNTKNSLEILAKKLTKKKEIDLPFNDMDTVLCKYDSLPINILKLFYNFHFTLISKATCRYFSNQMLISISIATLD